MRWYDYTLAYVAPGFLILAILFGNKAFENIFNNNGLVWIGKNSYAIYLWHVIILYPFKQLSYFYNPLIVVLIYIFVSIFIGALSTMTIERYFLSIRQRRVP